MSLRPSEIDRLIDVPQIESESDLGLSDSETENNILSYSGSDDYEPSSDDIASDEECSESSSRKIARVGLHNSVSDVLRSLEATQPSTSSQTSPNTGTQNPTIHTPRVIQIIKGKNGHSWTEEPRTTALRTRASNILYTASKVKGIAKNANTASESFLSFITNDDLDLVVRHTNTEIHSKQTNYGEVTATIVETNVLELKGLIGILLFSAVHKDNHVNIKDLFDVTISGNIYRAAFSEKRFNFLLDSLRFDDKQTRPARRQNDKLAPIRELWDKFIKRCPENYEPSPYLTIDEQLLGFRGRCPFKMYIPNKPSKYGLKIVLLCDVSTKYMLNAEPYLGKGSTNRNEPASHHYIKTLSAPYYGSNRNITMDNWFTSIPIAHEMINQKLTVLGTIRRNKRELPLCMTTVKNREVGDTRYLFDGTVTLISQKVKSNKVVCIVSTMHDNKGTSSTGKPFIVEHYNQTKGGVDAFDQLCSGVSCSRKTKRWPLCMFYGMINMAGVNSWITYKGVLQLKKKPLISRKAFLQEVYREFVTPLLDARIQLPTLQRSLKLLIGSVLEQQMGRQTTPVAVNNPANHARTTCKICPAKKRRMTTHHCTHCGDAYCNEHRGLLCSQCTSDL